MGYTGKAYKAVCVILDTAIGEMHLCDKRTEHEIVREACFLVPVSLSVHFEGGGNCVCF